MTEDTLLPFDLPAVKRKKVDAASLSGGWSSVERARIVAESHEPGATAVAVAARHGISTWSRWRRRAREGFLLTVTAGVDRHVDWTPIGAVTL